MNERALSTGHMLATVAALATLTMVLPNFTSNAGPTFRPAQLAFAALMCRPRSSSGWSPSTWCC